MPQYVGSVYLDVRFDPSQAEKSLKSTMTGAGAAAGASAGDAVTKGLSDRLFAFGTQATRVGRQLSFGLSVPLTALGAASEKAFESYDTNLTKVAALTGTGAEQTAAWSNQVLDLASKYGVAGEDAAQALYLITSSGIKGQAAMDTLDTTMKASAVGMGDAATIAGLLTSAMNAYGESTLPAARAADILTGAVQESKIPADQLAGSIGNLLPFGPQLGVSFAQITGAMAALSLQGTNSAMAATQLRGIFNSLLDPSVQAAESFEKVGLSATQLRQVLSTQGIVPMLKTLRDAIVRSGGDTDAQLANMFGNVRALTGVFGLLNDQGGKIDRVFQNTANSAGKLDTAFRITADSGAFKAKQATEGMHNEMILLGQDIAPVVASFTNLARAGLAVFNNLGPLKPVLVGIGASLALLGPAAYSIGAIADVGGLATRTLKGMSAAAAASSEAQTAVAVAAENAAAANVQLAVAQQDVAATSEELAGSEGVAAASATAAAEAESRLAMAEFEAAGAAQVLADSEDVAAASAATMGATVMAALVPIAIVVAGIGAAMVIWSKRMENAQADADALGDTFANKVAAGGIADANATIAKTQAQIRDLSAEVDNSHAPWDADYRAELEKGIDALNGHVDATQKDITASQALSAQTGESADKIFAWLSNERNAGRVYADNDKALEAYTEAMAKHGDVVSTATTDTGKLVDKAKDIADKFFGAEAANKAYADAVQKVSDAQRAAVDADRAVGDAKRDEVDATQKVLDAEQRHRDSLTKVTDAQHKLADAQKALNVLAAGPTRQENYDVRSAQLALQRAQAALRKPGQDALDKQQSQLDVERAQMDLDSARGEHAKNLAKAQGDVADAQKGLTDAQRESVDAAKAISDAQRGVESAHRKVEDALRAADKAQRDARQSELDLAPAADGAAKKQSALADALGAGAENGSNLVKYLKQLQDEYPASAGAIQPLVDKAGALNTFFNPPAPAPGAPAAAAAAPAPPAPPAPPPPPPPPEPAPAGDRSANFGDFTGGLNIVGTTIAEHVTDWKDDITGWIGDAAKEVPNRLSGFADNLKTGLGIVGSTIWDTTTGFVSGALHWIGDSIYQAPIQLAAFAGAIGGWIFGEALALPGQVATLADNITGWIGTAITEGPQKLAGLAGAIGGWILDEAKNIGSDVAGWASSIWDWVTGAATSAGVKLGEIGSSVVDWAKGLPGLIWSGIGDVGGFLHDKGKELIKGLFEGMLNVIGKIGGWASAIADKFREAFIGALDESPAPRATGGTLAPGQLASVNELGLPELWESGGRQYLLPLHAGQVVPLKPITGIPVRGGDGGTGGDTFNIYETSGKPRQTAYEVRREMHKASFLSGRRG